MENYQNTNKAVAVLTTAGLNPYSNERDNFGSGIAEGLVSVADPLGILAQYVGRQMGYDIRTIGGVGFFSGAKADISNEKGTFGSICSKVLVSGAGVGCWTNPTALPILIAMEAIATGVNLYAHIRRYKVQETLKVPALETLL